MRKSFLVVALLVVGVAAVTHAQMAHRLKGSLRSTSGAPIWDARDLVPKEQRQALAAAIDDLRGIARVQ